MTEAREPREEWKNREGLDDYNVRWNWVTGPSSSGFSAVLRVKNEASSLPWVLPGVLRSVEQVIVVDNGSTDGTPEIAKEIAAEEEGLKGKLEVLSYPFEVSRCGPEHLMTYPDSVHSLTYFYNWSFSQVKTRYALKWDGDMVLTPEGEQILRDLSWQLEGIDGTVKMALSPVYVESERVAHVDLERTHRELCGWRNTSDHTFIKCFDWEFMPPRSHYLFHMPDWMCFELKWLGESQFAHWSHTDFQTERHRRKLREWEVSHALLAGVAPPEGVVRVESPDGTHVIEHLRKTYAALRRYNLEAPTTRGSIAVADGMPAAADGRGSGPLPSPRDADPFRQLTYD